MAKKAEGGTPSIEYRVVPIQALSLNVVSDIEASARERQDAKKSKTMLNGNIIRSVEIEGEQFTPTSRFWQSLYARFNINNAFFRFFDYDEVFKRISEREANDLVRICIERTPSGQRVLAATGLNRPVIFYEDLQEILSAYRSESGVKYADGIVTSTHTPHIGHNPFKVAGDQFRNQFVVHAPIDGYGQPNIYLSLLRLICSNGMTALARSFRTTLALGHGSDSVRTSLRRALEAFSNDEGYALMRGRFEMATRSWASLREQQDLYRLLLRLQSDTKLRSGAIEPGQYSGILSDLSDYGSGGGALLQAYNRMTGDPLELYHTDPNVLSEKRLRTLPVGCKVYDLFNFATEVATHHVSESTNRTLQGWIGNMLSGEYDLEDSCDQFDSFKDRFLPQRSAEDEEDLN